MTQLKTLKEIQESSPYHNTENYLVNELRAEAIKWIKELERLRVSGEPQPTVKKWVKDFFNITDEEY